MKALLFSLMILLGAFAGARAEDPPLLSPAHPQDFTYHLRGLFAPDREEDLRQVLGELPGIELVNVDFEHAEATFRYDPKLVFKDRPPEKFEEEFGRKLEPASHGTFGILPKSTTPRGQLTRVEIPIGILDCRACAFGAYQCISRLDGVVQASVDRKAGLVSALIDPAKTNREALAEVYKKREILRKVTEGAAP